MGTEIRFILNFADVEISFFETPHQLEKVLENTDECPNLKTAIIYKKPSKSEDEIINNKKIKVILYKDLLKEGKEIFEADKDSVPRSKPKWTRQKLMTLQQSFSHPALQELQRA